MAFLEDEPVAADALQGRHPRRHARPLDHARAVRLRVQEQGRPAAARRDHRLPAVAARRPAGRGHRAAAPARTSRARPPRRAVRALAFKVMTDPYVGKLTYFRVYSGKLKAGSHVYNATTGKKERVGRILQMHANHREEREMIGAGEIAAAVGLKFTTTGDTLTDQRPSRSCSSRSCSPSPSSRSRSSRRRRPTRTSSRPALAQPLRGGPDVPRARPTRRPARRSSPAWASCTSRSSSTACCASSRSTPTSASRRSPTARRCTEGRARSRASSCARPAAAASTATSSSRSSRTSPARGYEFDEQDHRRRDPEGVHQARSTRASRRRWSPACSPASPSSTSR